MADDRSPRRTTPNASGKGATSPLGSRATPPHTYRADLARGRAGPRHASHGAADKRHREEGGVGTRRRDVDPHTDSGEAAGLRMREEAAIAMQTAVGSEGGCRWEPLERPALMRRYWAPHPQTGLVEARAAGREAPGRSRGVCQSRIAGARSMPEAVVVPTLLRMDVPEVWIASRVASHTPAGMGSHLAVGLRPRGLPAKENRRPLGGCGCE